MKNAALALFFPIFLVSGLLLVFPPFASSQDVLDENGLVILTGATNFSDIASSAKYERDLIVRLNLTNPVFSREDLRFVAVDVLVFPSKGRDSIIRFNSASGPVKFLSFQLQCYVENKNCRADRSTVAKLFTAKVLLPAEYFAYDDSVLLRARLASGNLTDWQSEFTPLASGKAIVPKNTTANPSASGAVAGMEPASIVGGLAVFSSETGRLGMAVLALLLVGVFLDLFVKG